MICGNIKFIYKKGEIMSRKLQITRKDFAKALSGALCPSDWGFEDSCDINDSNCDDWCDGDCDNCSQNHYGNIDDLSLYSIEDDEDEDMNFDSFSLEGEIEECEKCWERVLRNFDEIEVV